MPARSWKDFETIATVRDRIDYLSSCHTHFSTLRTPHTSTPALRVLPSDQLAKLEEKIGGPATAVQSFVAYDVETFAARAECILCKRRGSGTLMANALSDWTIVLCDQCYDVQRAISE